MAGLVPAIPIIGALSILIEIAGTSPATTPPVLPLSHEMLQINLCLLSPPSIEAGPEGTLSGDLFVASRATVNALDQELRFVRQRIFDAKVRSKLKVRTAGTHE